jgi:hypothetical protein
MRLSPRVRKVVVEDSIEVVVELDVQIAIAVEAGKAGFSSGKGVLGGGIECSG